MANCTLFGYVLILKANIGKHSIAEHRPVKQHALTWPIEISGTKRKRLRSVRRLPTGQTVHDTYLFQGGAWSHRCTLGTVVGKSKAAASAHTSWDSRKTWPGMDFSPWARERRDSLAVFPGQWRALFYQHQCSPSTSTTRPASGTERFLFTPSMLLSSSYQLTATGEEKRGERSSKVEASQVFRPLNTIARRGCGAKSFKVWRAFSLLVSLTNHRRANSSSHVHAWSSDKLKRIAGQDQSHSCSGR